MKALYPGSFDPITNGHIDIIKQACELFEVVVIGITKNPKKKTMFSLLERARLIRESITEDDTLRIANTDVVSYAGLTVDHANFIDANILIRGLRAISDFETEFQMALYNRKLGSGINTAFLIPDETRVYLSSSSVKEIVAMGGIVDQFVPKCVAKALNGRKAQ